MIQLHYDIFTNFWYHLLAHLEVDEPSSVYNEQYVNATQLNFPKDVFTYLSNNIAVLSHFPFYGEVKSTFGLWESLLEYFDLFPEKELLKYEFQIVSESFFLFLEAEYEKYKQGWQTEIVFNELNAFKNRHLEKFTHALKFMSFVTDVEFKGDLHVWLINSLTDSRGKSVGFSNRKGFAIAVPELDKMSEDILFVGVHELAHYFTDRLLLQNKMSLSMQKDSHEYIRRESLADFVSEMYFKDIGKQIISKWTKQYLPEGIIKSLLSKDQQLNSGIEIIHFGKYSEKYSIEDSNETEPVKDIFYIDKKDGRLYFFLSLIGRMVGVPTRYFKSISPLEFDEFYREHFIKAGLMVPKGYKYFRQSVGDIEMHNGFVKKVRFHMTDRCNLRCKYCYLSAGDTPHRLNEQRLFVDSRDKAPHLTERFSENCSFDKREPVPYNKSLVKLAREQRKDPTEAETIVWNLLKDRQFEDIKFRRQKPILNFIVDFYCPDLLLVIEVDGDYHKGQEEYDQLRTEVLNDLGIEVIRYGNEQVLGNVDVIKDDLHKRIQAMIKSKPSLPGEGDVLSVSCENESLCTSGEASGEGEINADKAIDYLNKLYGDDLSGIEVEFHGGGEPTLMIEEIKKIVSYIDSKTDKRTIRLQTNGVFSANIIDWIVENDVIVSVSIDGDKDINDAQRTEGTKAFETIITNIQNLIVRKVHVSTVSVITEYSQDKLDTIYEFIKSLGIKAMMFNPVHSFLGRSQQQDHSAKRDVDLMAFAKNYLRVKQKADKEGIYLVSDFLPDFYQYIPRNYQCDACKSGVGVYGNGDICSCTRAYDLGEGFSNPFVWANIALDVNIDIKNEKALKQRVTEKMPECSHCLLKWNCAGDCLLQCYQLNGDMYKVYADRCKAKIHYIVEYLKVVIGVSNFKESLKVANKDVVLIHFPAVTPMLPPPGVNYLANYLLNKGVRCEVIDVNKDMYFQHKENWSKTFSFQKNYQQDSGFEKFIDKYLTGIAEIVLNNKYKHVGLSCFDNTFDIVKKTLEIMKEKGIKNIFLGGPDVFMEIETYKDLLRKNFVSALILKEGEYKVLEYVQGNNRIKGVVTNNNIDEDVACFKDEKTIKTSEIPCLEKMSGFIDGVFSHQVIPICASRGCSSNCSFCSHKILWDGYRLKETQDVINEMQFYQKKYSCNLFYFTDMLLNGSSIWLKDFVYKLLHLEDKMYWSAYVRIDPMFNEEFCFNIAKAGAVYLSFGIESNSQRVLDIVNKGTKVEDNEMVVANVAKAGIFIHASFILGLPYEEVADVLVTLEFIKRNIWNIDHVEIFFFENLPQSSGFELAKEYLEQKADKDYYQLKKQLYEEIIVDFNRIGSGFLSSRQLYSGEANNFKKGLHEFYRKKYLGEQPLGDEKFLENAERIHSFKLAQIKLLDEYMGKISSSFVQ